jgi:hypothetical protein
VDGLYQCGVMIVRRLTETFMPDMFALLGKAQHDIEELRENYRELLRLLLNIKLGKVKPEEVLVQLDVLRWQVLAGHKVVQDEQGGTKIEAPTPPVENGQLLEAGGRRTGFGD